MKPFIYVLTEVDESAADTLASLSVWSLLSEGDCCLQLIWIGSFHASLLASC